MTLRPVPLVRRFVPVPKTLASAAELAASMAWSGQRGKCWPDLIDERLCIVLADAGAGKTHEIKGQARHLLDGGRRAFFIRIEDIDAAFGEAFEIGAPEDFEAWLAGAGEAWFYLDSVDEARLTNPRDFERALRRFERRIRLAKDRAHLVITSRPYAWRFTADAALIAELFGGSGEMRVSAPDRAVDDPDADWAEGVEQDGSVEREVVETHPGLQIYWLAALNTDDVRMFAAHRGLADSGAMLVAIERDNLALLTAKPFDLEGVIAQWQRSQTLGGRSTVLQSLITQRLDEPDPDRRTRQPLNPVRAREGAGLLALAVTMTGQPGIQTADQGSERTGLDAAAVLGWDAAEIDALLSRALFDDAIYGAVRFRHRDIRELLAAEYLAGLLQQGTPRHAIERLFFAERYGEAVIRPSMRPILIWLILFDEPIRARALSLSPEIAVEGGDPARLPLPERRRILADIVARIVEDPSRRAAQDNAAIARIASRELEADALALIERHGDDDEAIFFLGRFVWQGELTGCLDALRPIALDPARGDYARMVSARAVLSLSSAEEQSVFWGALLEVPEPTPWTLAAELMRNGATDLAGVDHVLALIADMPDRERFQATGFEQALGDYVDMLPRDPTADAPAPLSRFAEGANTLLEQKPYIERGDCRVSERYQWLMNSAMRAVERLIEARSPESFAPAVMSILLKGPALRFWRSSEYNERKTQLEKLVPAWPAFNDELFWTSIAEARRTGKTERVVDSWSVMWIGHYARFGLGDTDRVLVWIGHRDMPDDNLVALSLAFRIWVDADRPAALLDRLRAAADAAGLGPALEAKLTPPVNASDKRLLAEDRRWKHEREREKRKSAKNRAEWIAMLRADPDRVRRPKIAPGELSNDQYWLMSDLHRLSDGVDQKRGEDWRKLIPDFGEEVARAYRDAAMRHWRHYRAPLGSEGASTSSVPYALIFAMAGLGIEAAENPDFPQGLSDAEVASALRFIHWELNGFPEWLPALVEGRPAEALDHIWAELRWELDSTAADAPRHYILHDLAYYAGWLQAALAPLLLDWLATGSVRNHDALRYVLQILKGGEAAAATLAAVAAARAVDPVEPFRAEWFALWVDSDPAAALPALETFLTGLAPEEASPAAQQMLTALAGDGRGHGPTIGAYQTPVHLLRLYRLMRRFIPPEGDIDRYNGGAYSPTIRDHAKDARDRLFGRICELPGKDSYMALRALAADEPDPRRRAWILAKALERATLDADFEAWTAEQLAEFAKSAEITPKSHRELFDLGVARLIDFKAWLEEGNDSPARTYARVTSETEMRNLVAGWLRREAHGRYVCAQEAELANAQRPDLWLQANAVAAAVPIELKLVDKDWTGPVLAERLRNQLAGGYMRDARAGCGILLLLWKGDEPGRRWDVDGRRVDFAALPDALQGHWDSIAGNFPGVEAISVIGIDLSRRGQR